jgi:pyruvate formate lyase activating enzyme
MDAAMPDIKADPDNGGEYRRVTGMDGNGMWERLRFLAERGKIYELRTVVSPGLLDAESLVKKACSLVRQSWPASSALPRYRLTRCRPNGVRKETVDALVPPDDALMERLEETVRANGMEAVVV